MSDYPSIRPSLNLNFARTKKLDPRVTFRRASTGTYVDADGLIKTAEINTPRFDHNPTTGESLGLLVEEQRTNLLLNSGTLSTQNVTVTAAAHTLSFTGTGTITLSGTSTAGPLIGTGTGEANRVSLTFTPTAGTLTLTVSGTVTNAQLEAGSFRTSYIPTAGATATRSADVASITGANFSSWYRQDEGTVFVRASSNKPPGSIAGAFSINASGSGNNRLDTRLPEQSLVSSGGTVVANLTTGTITLTPGAQYTRATAYRVNDFAASGGGTTTLTDADGAVPVGCNQLEIGNVESGAAKLNGTIRRLTYWPRRLSNSTLQALTRP